MTHTPQNADEAAAEEHENHVYRMEPWKEISHADSFLAGIAFEKEKSKGLLQALEFYANGEGDVLDWDRVNDPSCIQDKGKTARAALREYRGEG